MLNWGGPPILAIVIPENRQDEERDTFYLAELGWPKGQVGVALAVGTIAGLIAHIPGGALVDWAPWKRGLAAAGIVMIAGSRSFWRSRPPSLWCSPRRFCTVLLAAL